MDFPQTRYARSKDGERRLSGRRRRAARPRVHPVVGHQRRRHVGGAVDRALPAPPRDASAGSSASTSAARASRIPVPLAALPTLEQWMRRRRGPSWRPRARERAALLGHVAGRPDGDALRRDLPGAHVGADPRRHVRAPVRDADYPWGFVAGRVPQLSLDELEERWGNGAQRSTSSRRASRTTSASGAGTAATSGCRSAPRMVRAVVAARLRERPARRPAGDPGADARPAPRRRTASSASGTAATSPSTFPGRNTSSCPARTISSTSATPRPMLGEIEEFLTGVRPAPEIDRVLATVLFTDIVGSTERAAALGDRAWRALLDAHHEIVAPRARAASRPGGRGRRRRPARHASTGRRGRSAAPAPSATASARSGIEIRAGLHTGEIELAGRRRARHRRAHRRAGGGAKPAPGEVLVSSTVKDLVAGSGIRFVDRGLRVLKGVPDEWRLFRVDPRPA